MTYLFIWDFPQIKAKAGDKFFNFKVCKYGCLFEFSFPEPFGCAVLILTLRRLDLLDFLEDEGFILTPEFGDDDLEFLSDEIALAFFTRFLETFFLAAASAEEVDIEVVFEVFPEFDFDEVVCFGFDSFFPFTIFSPSSCLVVPA